MNRNVTWPLRLSVCNVVPWGTNEGRAAFENQMMSAENIEPNLSRAAVSQGHFQSSTEQAAWFSDTVPVHLASAISLLCFFSRLFFLRIQFSKSGFRLPHRWLQVHSYCATAYLTPFTDGLRQVVQFHLEMPISWTQKYFIPSPERSLPGTQLSISFIRWINDPRAHWKDTYISTVLWWRQCDIDCSHLLSSACSHLPGHEYHRHAERRHIHCNNSRTCILIQRKWFP